MQHDDQFIADIVSLQKNGSVHAEPLDPALLEKAKQGFSTRHFKPADAVCMLTGEVRPRAGDLVLVRVERIRNHTRIELPSGRRARIFPGDLLVMCYGNRYAPAQYEGFVPDALGPCQIAAAGGVVADVRLWNQSKKPPTEVQALGILADAGGTALNIRRWALPDDSRDRNAVPVIAVVGTSMDAGKTTTLQNLLRGLGNSGYRVGCAKVTGTGSGGDLWSLLDAGAVEALDFTDAGHASTYCLDPEQVLRTTVNLINRLSHAGLDMVLVEVADGLLQQETWSLVNSETFRNRVDGVMLAGADSMGALAGLKMLQAADLPVIGVSGKLNAAPLNIRELESVTSAQVYSADDLFNPMIIERLVADLVKVEPLQADAVNA